MSIPTIAQDAREIKRLHFDDKDFTYYTAGQCGVTKIVAYQEKGPLDFFTCFAVYHGEEIIARVPAWKVTVLYKTDIEKKMGL